MGAKVFEAIPVEGFSRSAQQSRVSNIGMIGIEKQSIDAIFITAGLF